MPYIGNTIRAADDYRLIDDISSGFNGSTTSFALQVSGSAPVPFPKSPQQVLISVNGVIQEPDPTGVSGFNLVGTNIVFSSAPTNGHAFFGIIYATADYLNAGGNFPAGSLGAPSITFTGDENTGLYRKGSGSVGFVSDATEIANFDSNGITISSGSLVIADSIIHSGDTNTKIRFSDTDEISFETGGVQRLKVDDSAAVFNETGASVDFRVEGNGDTNLFFVDASADRIGIGTNLSNTPSSILTVKPLNSSNGRNISLYTSGSVGNKAGIFFNKTQGQGNLAEIQAEVESGDNKGSLHFNTSLSTRMSIDENGQVGIGTSSPAEDLHISADTPVLRLTDSSTSRSAQFVCTDGSLRLDADNDNDQASTNISFRTDGSERMRLDTAGNLVVGATSAQAQNSATLMADGEVTAAGFYFSNNVGSAMNTEGIRRPTTNCISFDTASTERMRLDANGKLGIGTTSPSANLHVKDASGNTEIKLQGGASTANDVIAFLNSSGSTRGNITYDTDNDFVLFNVNTLERMRIDSSGRLLINKTTNRDKYFNGTYTGKLQVEGTDDTTRLTQLVHNSNSASQHIFVLGKSRGGVGSYTSVADGDFLGTISFQGADGDEMVDGARIEAQVNGTPSNDAMPTDLLFKTNTGGASPTERMRITESGNVGIGTNSPQAFLEITGTNAGGNVDALHLRNNGSTDNTAVEINMITSTDQTNTASRSFVKSERQSSSSELVFGTGDIERMRLSESSLSFAGSKSGNAYPDATLIFNIKDSNGNSKKAQILSNKLNDIHSTLEFGTTKSNTFAERMRIHTNGFVGIGTTSPQARLQVNDTNPVVAEFYRSDGGTNDEARIALGALSSNIPSQRGVQLAAVNNGAGHDFSIRTSPSASLGPTEKMKVTSDGTIFLSTNTNASGGGSATWYVSGSQQQIFRGNAGDYIHFKTTSGTGIGRITNISDTSTNYNTSSDYRLKENETAISDGITRLKTLKPYRFNWKSDSSRIVDGFFAHEVTAVPEAVSGTKDKVAVQADVDEGLAINIGDPVYQSIDHSKLVPLLTAALQEAVAKIETLETKVAALEAA